MVDKLNILYLYGYNPDVGTHMKTIIPLIKNQSSNGLKIGIILIHDSVIVSSSKRKTTALVQELIELPIEFFAMTPDLKARGIDLNAINSKIKPIEYTDLVDILENSEKIISWM
ncbi:MAG: sulfurtransferase complex subunit TusB [Promethearchaeota archaeon]